MRNSRLVLVLTKKRGFVYSCSQIFLAACIFLNLISRFVPLRAAQQNASRLANATTDQSEETFTRLSSYDALQSDKTILGSTIYQGSKGTWVTVSHGKFSSPQAAKNVLAEVLKHATIVLERHSIIDSSGQLIGERVVALFPKVSSCLECHEIVWTEGRNYYRVASSSLQAALKFESRILARAK